jgi:hypothetical protein
MSSIAFAAARALAHTSSNQEHVIRVAGAADSLPPTACGSCAADARLPPRRTTALPVRRRSTRTRSTTKHTITHPPPLTPPPRHRAGVLRNATPPLEPHTRGGPPCTTNVRSASSSACAAPASAPPGARCRIPPRASLLQPRHRYSTPALRRIPYTTPP